MKLIERPWHERLRRHYAEYRRLGMTRGEALRNAWFLMRLTRRE
jgi:hypothetical protein